MFRKHKLNFEEICLCCLASKTTGASLGYILVLLEYEHLLILCVHSICGRMLCRRCSSICTFDFRCTSPLFGTEESLVVFGLHVVNHVDDLKAATNSNNLGVKKTAFLMVAKLWRRTKCCASREPDVRFVGGVDMEEARMLCTQTPVKNLIGCTGLCNYSIQKEMVLNW